MTKKYINKFYIKMDEMSWEALFSAFYEEKIKKGRIREILHVDEYEINK